MNQTDTKVLLTINLEGGILVRQKEAESGKWFLTKQDLNPNKKFPPEEGRKIVRSGKWYHRPLKAIPAAQRLNISSLAYEDMVDPDTCPRWWRKPSEWKKLEPKQRLEMHLWRICQSVGGHKFSYTVVED